MRTHSLCICTAWAALPTCFGVAHIFKLALALPLPLILALLLTVLLILLLAPLSVLQKRLKQYELIS